MGFLDSTRAFSPGSFLGLCRTVLRRKRPSGSSGAEWQALEGAARDGGEKRVVAALRRLAEEAAARRNEKAGSSEAATRDSDTIPVGDLRRPEEGEAPAFWGHLEVLGKLGEGSFGQVYRVRDTRLDRPAALKLIRPSRRERACSAEELLREGRLLARIKHPNVATVFGADYRDGKVGFWMELAEGETLADRVRERGPLETSEAVRIGLDLCRALAAVHTEGLVHQDVKAENVMREAGGRIVLVDFGIGCDLEQAASAKRSISGTPPYLAPECLEGEPASFRSDLYSLGVLLFFLVAGELPVPGSSVEEMRRAHREDAPLRLRDLRPQLPPRFVAVVEKALSKDPAERFDTAEAMAAALEALLGSQVPGRRWRPVLAVSAGLLSLAVLLTVAWLGRGHSEGAGDSAKLLSDSTLKGLAALAPSAGRAPLEKPEAQALGSDTEPEGGEDAPFGQGAAFDPGSALAWARLSMAQVREGHMRDALESSAAALELAEALPLAQRWYVRGVYLLHRLDYREAVESFEHLARLDPDNPEAYRQIANCKARLGRYGEAVEAARRASLLAEASLTPRIMAAHYLIAAERPREAIREARAIRRAEARALQRSPDEAAYLQAALGLAQLAAGQLGEAERELRALAGGDGDYAASYGPLHLAQLLVVAEQLTEAEDLLERTLRIDREVANDRNWNRRCYRLTRIALLLEDERRARWALGRMHEPEALPSSLRDVRNAALVYAQLGEVYEVESRLEVLERIENDFSSSISRGSAELVRGALALARGDEETAEDRFRDARITWPGPETDRALAELLLAQGRSKEAKGILKELFASKGRILAGEDATIWTRSRDLLGQDSGRAEDSENHREKQN